MDYHTGNIALDTELDARFDILSPTVRHLLNGEAVPTLANVMAQKHGLPDEMRDGIESEITLVLMHLEPVDDFAANLMVEYFVPPEAALEIEKEVTAQLFAPIMKELGRSGDVAEAVGDGARAPEMETAPISPVTPPVPASAPMPSASTPRMPSPNAAPTQHVPVARVMPHSAAEAAQDPRTSTELPNALLQNLKASLMHGAPEEPLEGTNPPPAYNSILDQKPPARPLPPTPPTA